MEKLIELLNEYEIERERKFEGFKQDRLPYYEWSNKELGDGSITYLWLNKEDYKGEELFGDSANAVLISKSYGFIKWLVENEKIDEKKVIDEADYYWTDEYDVYVGDVLYTRLIMMLAEKDEPIKFLVSILK